MTIKNFSELNEFEKKGLTKHLLDEGYHYCTLSSPERGTRGAWAKGKIMFEEQGISVEVE